MMREESRGADTAHPAFLKYASDGILFLSFLYISLRIFYDYRAGGNGWKQGDWLINNAAGPVRRGPFGSAIISISDTINLDPLFVVCTIQIALLAALFITFRLLVAEIRNPKVSILLVASPAIFTIFWAADPQGSVRKELIAFLAISLYALGAVRKNWLLLWLGAATFCVGALSHEAMVLFAPTFLALVFSSGLDKESATHALATIALIFCFSVFAFLFAIENSSATDTSKICAALVDKGLSDSICSGAISWLSYDSAYGFQAVISRLGVRSVGGFLISYAAALAPFIYIAWLNERKIIFGAFLILLALPFAPLYFVAVDWGRWMSFHIFSVTTILACAIAKDRLQIQRSPSDYYLLSLVGLGILISPSHTIGIVWGGVARRAASEFQRLLG